MPQRRNKAAPEDREIRVFDRLSSLGFLRSTVNLSSMSVFLVGYRGSGKSTVGAIVARMLGFGMLDTDQHSVAAAGRSIRDIFKQDGELRFRDLETQALRHALTLDKHVIATGGGIIVRDENRRFIRQSGQSVVYLRCDAEQLQARIHGDVNTIANRPSLTELGGGIEEIRQLLALRDPLYREVATIVVEAGGRETEDVADDIVARLGG